MQNVFLLVLSAQVVSFFIPNIFFLVLSALVRKSEVSFFLFFLCKSEATSIFDLGLSSFLFFLLKFGSICNVAAGTNRHAKNHKHVEVANSALSQFINWQKNHSRQDSMENRIARQNASGFLLQPQ